MADPTEIGAPSSDDSAGGGAGRRKDGFASLVALPGARGAEHPSHNLPLELSSFVGREREIDEVKKGLLESTRLLTLTGAGGCGKTRLALRVARDLVGAFEEGVWLVELASLSDPKLVAQAVARALGVRERPDFPLTAAVADSVGSRRMLLVLDNCEHLIEATAQLVDTLLGSCEHLRVLATSREALGVAGETNWLVPSLTVPGTDHLPAVQELTRYEAVRLFAERARSRRPAFALTPENAPAVVEVCRRLDGIPLAIELATARITALAVEQIAERLTDSLGFLTTGDRTRTPRQRTLRAALAWSYELLSEPEQKLFGRLSVFAGGWTLEAAEKVGAGGGIEQGEVLDLLSSLVEKSLVVAEAGGDGALRYRMLEPVRQFGREKLREGQEAPEVRQRHAGHYLAFVETVEPELLGADQGLWLRRLRTEFANLREAFSWSLEGQEEERARLRLRLATALWRFWGAEGLQEGRQWLQTALDKDPGGFPAVRAKALSGLGWILLFQRDYARAIAALEEAIALYKELGDRSGAAFALGNLGYAVLHGGYSERVPAFVEEAEALIKEDLDGHTRAFLLLILGSAAIEEDELDSAVSQLEESLALCRELGNLRVASMPLFALAMLELGRDHLDRGATLLEEGARIMRDLADKLGGLYYVWGLGKVNALRGQPVRAARLWGAAEALREQMGVSLSHFDLAHSGYEQDLAAVRSALGQASFDAAWTKGRAMSPEQAIEYALGDPPHEEEEEKGHPHSSGAAVLRILALGSARVEKDGRPLDSPDWTHKPRELLFYLLSHPQGRTKEQIGLALWPDASTARLRSSLHDTVFRLRRALGGKEWIVFEKGRYAFERSLEYYFDVEALEGNLSEARRLKDEAPERAIRHLQEATGLYGGDFLEDSADGEWAMVRQEELKRAYQEALLLLGRLLSARGRHAETAEAYRKAIAHDELLEEAHRGLMRSQAALGERGWALRHYEELVGLLDEQLGAPPAPETRALHERLRAGEEL